MKQLHWRPVAILLLTLAIAFGSVQCKHGQTRGGNIPPGLDAFRTAEGTQTQFEDEFTIPAGFFDTGSAPFRGTIALAGDPLGSYGGKTTAADTIVERRGTAKVAGGGYGATVPIEVTALSLRSVQPIEVSAGGAVQRWDVKVGLSPSRRSEGSMTITRRNGSGGTYRSELVVYPLYTFTRQGDGAERKLDVGAIPLPASSVEKIRLRTEESPWVSTRTAAFEPGVNGAGQRTIVVHGAPRHSHRVIFEEPLGANPF